MNRLFVLEKLIEGKEVILEEEVNYLSNVVRLRLGSQLKLFNNIDGEFLCIVQTNSKKSIALLVQRKLRDSVSVDQLNIYIAPIKMDKFLFAIDSAIQLGATCFTPVMTSFSQISNLNNIRINKRIKEAIEQSGRVDMPELHNMISLDKMCSNLSENLIWAFEGENKYHMSSIDLSSCNSILIGPEGGFQKEEIELLRNHPKILSISLGKYILRSEIALITAISQYQLLK